MYIIKNTTIFLVCVY